MQPNLDGLSCAFARLFSIGSALSFEVRGLRDEVSYFTSFYDTRSLQASSKSCIRRRGRGSPVRRPLALDRDVHRSPLPEFDAHTRLVDASLRRVFDEARDYAWNPCVLPRPPQPSPGLGLGLRRRHPDIATTVSGQALGRVPR